MATSWRRPGNRAEQRRAVRQPQPRARAKATLSRHEGRPHSCDLPSGSGDPSLPRKGRKRRRTISSATTALLNCSDASARGRLLGDCGLRVVEVGIGLLHPIDGGSRRQQRAGAGARSARRQVCRTDPPRLRPGPPAPRRGPAGRPRGPAAHRPRLLRRRTPRRGDQRDRHQRPGTSPTVGAVSFSTSPYRSSSFDVIPARTAELLRTPRPALTWALATAFSFAVTCARARVGRIAVPPCIRRAPQQRRSTPRQLRGAQASSRDLSSPMSPDHELKRAHIMAPGRVAARHIQPSTSLPSAAGRPPRRQRPVDRGALDGPPPQTSPARHPSFEAAARDSEPDVLVVHARGAAPAGRRPHAPGVVGEPAAAEHAVRVVAGRIEQVPAPLPHVAERVEQSVEVRQLRRRRPAAR